MSEPWGVQMSMVFSYGAVGGIRTLVPLLTTTRFPVVLVMTSSIPLHIHFLLTDSVEYYTKISTDVKTFFRLYPTLPRLYPTLPRLYPTLPRLYPTLPRLYLYLRMEDCKSPHPFAPRKDGDGSIDALRGAGCLPAPRKGNPSTFL